MASNGKRTGRRRQHGVATGRGGAVGVSPAVSQPGNAVVPEAQTHGGAKATTAAVDLAEIRDKRVAFYQTATESFLENRMERDKGLLTLCTAGVGVIVTLWTTIGVESRLELGLGLAAAAAFMVGILAVLRIFSENANYLEDLIREQDYSKPHKLLAILDRCVAAAFYTGLLLALAGALVITNRKYLRKTGTQGSSNTMTDKKWPDSAKPAIVTGVPSSPHPAPESAPARAPGMPLQRVDEGVQGLHRLAPLVDTGSLRGLHNLAPKGGSDQPTSTPAPSSPPSPQGSAKSTNSDQSKKP